MKEITEIEIGNLSDPDVSVKPDKKASETQLTLSDLTYRNSWEEIQTVFDDLSLRGTTITEKSIKWKKRNSTWEESISSDWRKALALEIAKHLVTPKTKVSAAQGTVGRNRRMLVDVFQSSSKQQFIEKTYGPKDTVIPESTLEKKRNSLKGLISLIEEGLAPDQKNVTEKIHGAYHYRVPRERIAEKNEFPPLRDEFVSELGFRCFWILDNWIQPMHDLLTAWNEAIEQGEVLPDDWESRLFKNTHNKNYLHCYAKPKARERILSFLSRHFSEEKNYFPKPEFDLTFDKIGGSKGSGKYTYGGENSLISEEGLITGSSNSIFVDPAYLVSGIRKQFNLIQAALYFLTGLLSGPRISEIRTLSHSEPVQITESHAVFNTKTFKLCPDDDGENRPWVIPKNHAEWIQKFFAFRPFSQVFMKGYNANCFWVSQNYSDSQVAGATLINWVRDISKTMGLSDPTLDQEYDDFINHSLRKTIAKYIAISMVGGQKYLFDMFGHRWFEMTLHYINSPGMTESVRNVEAELHAIGLYDSKGLEEQNERNAEFSRMVEEQRTEFVLTKIIEIIEDRGGRYFGAGVAQLRSRAAEYTPIYMKTTRETASELSAQGSAYEQVAPEVYCLKDAKSVGRCAEGNHGTKIVPSNCTGDCPYHVAENGRIHLLEKSIRLGFDGVTNILESMKPSETVSDYAGDLRRHAISIISAIDKLQDYKAPLPSICDDDFIQELIRADKSGNFMEVFGCEQ